MTRPIDFLRQTFDQMPDFFYSQEFYGALRKTKIPEKAILNGQATEFLKKYATQQGFKSRSWLKKTAKTKIDKLPEAAPAPLPFNPIPEMIAATETPHTPLTEDAAIAFLKERGYKIFKYQEI